MPLTAQPFANNEALDRVRDSLNVNVTQPERIGSIAAGAGLILYGASRRSLGGFILALLGGALVYRGSTGHCHLYEKLGINSRQLNSERGVPGDKGIKVVRTITVSRSPDEVYRYWRKLDNLAHFMQHVQSVRELDDRRSAWVVKGPMGRELQWTAQIITDRAGEMIAWESLPGAEVQNAGSVWFTPSNNGGTEIKVALQYYPPAGIVGAAVATIFGESPDAQLAADLERFKSAIEAPEAAAPPKGF